MIKIEIIATEDKKNSPEYKGAEYLKEMFERDFKPIENGRIIILPSVYCYGQEVKDIDIVVIGILDNVFRNIKTKVKIKDQNNKWKTADNYNDYNIAIQSFCWCIEIKDHDSRNIKFQGTQTLVKYNNSKHEEKWHDATYQSEQQKYSLKNFLEGQLGYSPYISNLIWLRNIEISNLPSYTNNLLPSNCNFTTILEKACAVNQPLFYPYKGHGYFSCTDQEKKSDFAKLKQTRVDEINEIFDLFTKVENNLGKLTREKLEKITKQALLKDQKYAQAIGKKLVIIRGRAGTGKTIKLLHIAYDLYNKYEQRCLILTYNKALVSDLRRMVALAQVETGIGKKAINIRTIHKFIRVLMIGFGILNDRNKDDFLDKYGEFKTELINYIKNELITKSDIQDLMKSRHHEVVWDTILIDEGQDFPEDEKEILFTIFDPKQFIIADGVDQLIRSQKKLHWTKNTDHHQPIISEKRSLRQEPNLCNFVKKYADQIKLKWDIKSEGQLLGGRVIILPMSKYNQEFYHQIFKECKKDGNQAYEMLFLAPPSLVYREYYPYTNQEIKEKRYFKLREKWSKWGIQLWDGTNENTRDDYPKRIDEHRVVQYDSCRGLEGWTTVCLCMDQFFEHKCDPKYNPLLMPSDNDQLTLGLYSKEEKQKLEEKERRKNAFLWTMIPLTRAIDTLVITLENPQSEYALILKEVADQCSDFVEWID